MNTHDSGLKQGAVLMLIGSLAQRQPKHPVPGVSPSATIGDESDPRPHLEDIPVDIAFLVECSEIVLRCADWDDFRHSPFLIPLTIETGS